MTPIRGGYDDNEKNEKTEERLNGFCRADERPFYLQRIGGHNCNLERRGTPIVAWYAQTRVGCRMIGTFMPYDEIRDEDVKHVRLVTCPICKGRGRRPVEVKGATFPAYRSCPVCDGTGMTTKGYEKRWRDWQLEEIRINFAEG